jgi:c-di-GMP-binding flagellar brake protein YcgR
MSNASSLDPRSTASILQWAVDKQAPLSVSLLPEARWHSLRSQLLGCDPAQGAIQVLYPLVTDGQAPPEILPGSELGISFRRGHKKCVFVSSVVLRRTDTSPKGQPLDTLILRAPRELREFQRRLYQRVIIPAERFIAAKLWEGGAPGRDDATWPLCAGRVANLSAGGVLVDIRAEHNPRLSVGEIVGVEISVRPGQPSFCVNAQYRHCILSSPDRLGIGLQFVGLEIDVPGRTTLPQLAELIRSLRHDDGSDQ